MSFESTARSVRITGIPARLASFRTASQPLSTTGENAITLTCCWMYERIAWIWFSCFCWASENLRLMPAAFADDWTDFVFAVRQPLSEPTCEKPRVIAAAARCCLAGALVADPASNGGGQKGRTRRAVMNHFLDTRTSLGSVDADVTIGGVRAVC